MKTRFLKLIDRLVGVFLTACLPTAKVRAVTNIQSFLVIRPGGIGDAVLLIPTILALKKNYPEAQVTILAEKRNGAVFKLHPAINNVLLYENPCELLTAIFSHYDVVIDTEQWHRLSAVVARLTRAPMLIGYATNERQRLFSHSIAYSHEEYEAESFYHLLTPLHSFTSGLTTLSFLHITPDLKLRAEDLVKKVAEAPFIVIFPGASIPEKCWDADRFYLLAALITRVGVRIVVVGGWEDAAEGEAIVARSSGLNLAGKTTLGETAAIIARGSVLVSGDSGILHIGVGLGKHTVSLFGPSNTHKWAPKGINHIVKYKNLQCSPCSKFGYTPKCKINAKCMSDITVDEVFEAVMTLLERQGIKPSKDLSREDNSP